MLVRLLSARTFRAQRFSYPIRAFAKHIERLGMRVEIHFKAHARLGDCDVLGVVSEHLRKTTLNRNPPTRIGLLERYRDQRCRLIWFDVSDSTGSPKDDVVPVVDLYAKNQLLRNRMLYTQELHGWRYYTDYYKKLKGVVGDFNTRRRVVRPEDIHKLAVSWNIGMGYPYRASNTFGRWLRTFGPHVNYPLHTTPSVAHRNLQVSYRTPIDHKKSMVSFQREETRRQLAEMETSGDYTIVYEGTLPSSQYMSEMRRTLIVPSPFGSGEICTRDFEALCAGATLLKPNMRDIDTWPNYYEPGVTYVPHAWDFSDFRTKILELLDSPSMSHTIAQAGQERYVDSVSPPGGEAFARHFAGLLQPAAAQSRGQNSQTIGSYIRKDQSERGQQPRRAG